jgi:hypothetical protein
MHDACQHVDNIYKYAVSNENSDSILNSLLKMKDFIKHGPNTYGGAMQSEENYDMDKKCIIN